MAVLLREERHARGTRTSERRQSGGNNVEPELRRRSYASTGNVFERASYGPYLRGLYVHENTISDFGSHPEGQFADPARLAPVVGRLFAALAANRAPQRLPAFVWDGIVDPATGTTAARGQGGSYRGNQRVCSSGNLIDLPVVVGQISRENLDLDLLGPLSGTAPDPVFPFPPRLACTLTLPEVTGLP